MEETFILKYYGHFSMFEMANMTAEERKWVIERIQKEKDKEAEATKSATSVTPGIPHIPHPPPHR